MIHDRSIGSSIAALILAAIVMLGLVLRITPWAQNRLLEDEALYAYWGLQIATGADLLLSTEPVDKPPLYPYVLALSFWLTTPLRASSDAIMDLEAASRLPSILASTTSIVLVYGISMAVSQSTLTGLLAALLQAISPFDILFATTTFTDPLLVLFVLAAALGALRGRFWQAGIFAGLAFATKQQAILFLPLVMLLAIGSKRLLGREPSNLHTATAQSGRGGGFMRGFFRHKLVQFGTALVVPVSAVFCWDSTRSQRPGFLQQSAISYGGLNVELGSSFAARASEWLHLVGCFWVSPWFNAFLALALTAWGLTARRLPRTARPKPIELGLGIFVAAFLVLHVAFSFQTWDRYILGLVPLLAILASRAIIALQHLYPSQRFSSLHYAFIGSLLIFTLSAPVSDAVTSNLPIGGDHGAYDGIDQVAAYIRDYAPSDSVLYHYWLGYHYRFYLHGHDLRTHWYPTPQDLTEDAYVYRRMPRYLVFPSWKQRDTIVQALCDAGIELSLLLETTRRDGTTSFQLYELVGPDGQGS